MAFYVGVLDGSGDVSGVRIPDLPGCCSGGRPPEEAVESAISAVREWAEHVKAHGEEIPPARSVAEILKNGEIDVAAGEAAVMIPFSAETA